MVVLGSNWAARAGNSQLPSRAINICITSCMASKQPCKSIPEMHICNSGSVSITHKEISGIWMLQLLLLFCWLPAPDFLVHAAHVLFTKVICPSEIAQGQFTCVLELDFQVAAIFGKSAKAWELTQQVCCLCDTGMCIKPSMCQEDTAT